MRRLVLASSSVSRARLLGLAHVHVDETVAHSLDEHALQISLAKKIKPLTPSRLVAGLAQAKARNIRDIDEHSVVLAADTMVALGRRVIGKPTSIDEAKETLKLLAGRSHRVYTAICLRAKVTDTPHNYEQNSFSHPVTQPVTNHVSSSSGLPVNKPAAQNHAEEDCNPCAMREVMREVIRVECVRVHMRRYSDIELKVLIESEEWRLGAGGYLIQGAGSMVIDRIIGDPTAAMGLPMATTVRLLTSFGVHPYVG